MEAPKRLSGLVRSELTTLAAIEGALGLRASSLSDGGTLDAAAVAKVDQLLAAYRIEIQKVNARTMRDRVAALAEPKQGVSA